MAIKITFDGTKLTILLDKDQVIGNLSSEKILKKLKEEWALLQQDQFCDIYLLVEPVKKHYLQINLFKSFGESGFKELRKVLQKLIQDDEVSINYEDIFIKELSISSLSVPSNLAADNTNSIQAIASDHLVEVSFAEFLMRAFNNIDFGGHKPILQLLLNKYAYKNASDMLETAEAEMAARCYKALKLSDVQMDLIDLKQRYADVLGVDNYLLMEGEIYKNIFAKVNTKELVDAVLEYEHETEEPNNKQLSMDQINNRIKLKHKFRRDGVNVVAKARQYKNIITPEALYMRGFWLDKSAKILHVGLAKIQPEQALNLAVYDGIVSEYGTKENAYASELGYTSMANCISFTVDINTAMNFSVCSCDKNAINKKSVIQLYKIDEVYPTTFFKPAIVPDNIHIAYLLENCFYDAKLHQIIKVDDSGAAYYFGGTWQFLESNYAASHVKKSDYMICSYMRSPAGYCIEEVIALSSDEWLRLNKNVHFYLFEQKYKKLISSSKVINDILPLIKSPNWTIRYGEGEVFVANTFAHQHLVDITCEVFKIGIALSRCDLLSVAFNSCHTLPGSAQLFDRFLMEGNPQDFLLYAAIKLKSNVSEKFYFIIDNEADLVYYYADEKLLGAFPTVTEANKKYLPFETGISTKLAADMPMDVFHYNREYKKIRSLRLRPVVDKNVAADLTKVNENYFLNAKLHRISLYNRKDLSNKVFTNANLMYVDFSYSDLNKTSFINASLFYVKFNHCNVDIKLLLTEAKEIDRMTLMNLQSLTKNHAILNKIQQRLDRAMPANPVLESKVTLLQACYRGHYQRQKFFKSTQQNKHAEQTMTHLKTIKLVY